MTQVVFSPDSNTIYASGLDRSVLAWDVTGSKGIAAVTSPIPAEIDSGMAADGSIVATWFLMTDAYRSTQVADGMTFDVGVEFPKGRGGASGFPLTASVAISE